jgi:hypothetical protein
METGIEKKIPNFAERNIRTLESTIFIIKAPIVVVVGSLCLKVIRNLMLIADGHPLMMQFLAK